MPEEPKDGNAAATLDAEEPEASASYTGGLEGGAYEIIRSRLDAHAKDLRGRLSKLNEERQNVFGAVDLELIATERISTANNCEPRDMIAIGNNRFIFGYNVHVGLKSTTDLNDVFDIFEYHPDDHTFHQQPLDLLDQGSFAEDFAYLYKYYKLTRFVKFLVIGPHLYMAFRIGKAVEDIKVFKWLLNDGELQYIGNRSDHEYVFPPQQEFEWTRAHRGMYREGMHPHVSIDDRLFVETVGGDLTIKIEDNTESGEGIYEEDVTNSRPDARRRGDFLRHRRQPDPAENPPLPGKGLPPPGLQRKDQDRPPHRFHRATPACCCPTITASFFPTATTCRPARPRSSTPAVNSPTWSSSAACPPPTARTTSTFSTTATPASTC